jgi:hypothetical protein
MNGKRNGKRRRKSHNKKRQSACKPGSVRPFNREAERRGDHSSGILFAEHLKQPTRMANLEKRFGKTWSFSAESLSHAIPIWFCSRWGLPCRPRCRVRGALLPHPFTLTLPNEWKGGLLSVALSLGSPPPDVIRHRLSMEPGLSSSDHSKAAARPTDQHVVRVPAPNVKQQKFYRLAIISLTLLQ